MGYLLNEPLHFVLTCVEAAEYDDYNTNFEIIGLEMHPTRFIDERDEDYIASRKYPGVEETFQYFQSLSIDSLILVIVLSTILSILLTAKQKSMETTLNLMFQCLTVFFSGNIPRADNKNDTVHKILIGSWLITAMFISIQYCSFILDGKIKTIPERKIDSWEQLFDWGLNFTTKENSAIGTFIGKQSNSLDPNLSERINPLSYKDWEIDLNELAVKLSLGEIALVRNRIDLVYTLIRMKRIASHIIGFSKTENIRVTKNKSNGL